MIIEELEIFLQDLKKYKEALDTYGSDNDLVEELIRKQGNYETVITELTGSPVLVPVYEGTCNPVNMWSEALRIRPGIQTDAALDFCIGAVIKAIGKLADYIKKGIRDKETGDLINKLGLPSSKPPKAFIAHEGETKALGKLKNFLDALGVEYLIAEIEPSDGRLVENQVDWAKGKADFAIILATKGKAIDKDTGKNYMGLNVADELGRAREVFKNKFILLIETGVQPHTNISGIVRERFKPQSMDKAFTKIAKELKNWRFLIAGKAGD